jgi:hypothetical protein
MIERSAHASAANYALDPRFAGAPFWRRRAVGADGKGEAGSPARAGAPRGSPTLPS